MYKNFCFKIIEYKFIMQKNFNPCDLKFGNMKKNHPQWYHNGWDSLPALSCGYLCIYLNLYFNSTLHP